MSTKPVVFVLTDIGKESDQRYREAIEPACNAAGARCVRAAELVFHGQVIQEIYSQIARSDAVIADVAQAPPNVWYELGLAHSLGKSTLLVAQDRNRIPFDLSSFRVLFLSDDVSHFKSELTTALVSLLEQPKDSRFREGLDQSHLPVQRQTTILVTDIVGSAGMIQALGELDFAEYWKQYLMRIAEGVSKSGGQVIKSIGDGYLATFHSPADALSFALEILKTSQSDVQTSTPLQLRFAIHVAPVTLRPTSYGADLIGEGVTVAVRLAQVAHAWEILLTDSAANQLKDRVPQLEAQVRKRSADLKGVGTLTFTSIELRSLSAR